MRPPHPSFASGQGSPAIEYTLTRIFGGESWAIREASLSPDGRWIVLAAGDETTRLSLWLVSTEGGEPIRLTTGPYIDDSPLWFPSGECIAFRSNRTPIYAIMTLPIDTLTGHPAGPPRQVTLDHLSAYFDVSPDGKWLAYTASNSQGGSLLRILPSRGGIARTVAEGVLAPMWSPDGKSVYYVAGGGRSGEYTLMRVAIDDGRPAAVFTWPKATWLIRHGSNRNFILRRPSDGLGYEIVNLAGHPVARIALPSGMNPTGISRQGDQILGIRTLWSAPLTILPVEGGPAQRFNETYASHEPLGWSPDGKRILFQTDLNGRSILFYAPLAGGPMAQVRIPEERSSYFLPVLSGDGKHILYAVEGGLDEVSAFKVYNIEMDIAWELSRPDTFTRRMGALGPTGAGGTVHRDGQDFLYFEKRGDRYELHASPPLGPSRLLRIFAGKLPQSVAVYREHIAWVENHEGDASLLLAAAGTAKARRILDRRGMLDMAVWSPDGHKIAVYYFDPDRSTGKNWDPAGRDLLVLEVDPRDGMVGKPQSYSIPAGHWWNPRWLPDGRRILVLGMDGNVWMVPLEQGARPVAITRDDPNGVWQFELSPDGRNIAYPSSIQRESSIWLLELKEALHNGF